MSEWVIQNWEYVLVVFYGRKDCQDDSNKIR